MNENLLERLAVDFCKTFIQIFNSTDNKNMGKIIGLYGARDETLSSLKDYMQSYFQRKNEKVDIVLQNKGYNINVGYYLEQI
jgi:predicted RNA-binding protein YlqC (UPF0109 family)